MMGAVTVYLKILSLGSGAVDAFLLYRLGEMRRRQRALAAENRRGRAERKNGREFFRTASRHQKELSRVKHDLNNNLQIIYTLMEEGETEKAQDFLKEMICNLQEGESIPGKRTKEKEIAGEMKDGKMEFR